jgi:phospholipid transport system substrate-binding protein
MRINNAVLLWAMAIAIGVGQPTMASEITVAIEQLDTGLLQAMKAGKASPFRQRYDLLAPLVIRAIDLDTILQAAVGPAWTSLPADQQAALKTAFQHYSIATYVAHFNEFDGERFDLSSATGGEQVVRVKIVAGKAGGETHALGYVMRPTAGGWKAVDVTADSTVSQVLAQQEEIRSLFKKGDAPGLLARLQEKTAELSGGGVR